MDIPLINFVKRLLEEPHTIVSAKTNTIIDGFSLSNIKLDIQLNIFSDKYNSAYFELYSLSKPHASKLNFHPNYRINDYKEVKPLIEIILQKLDSQPIDKANVAEYIKLWRQVLKGQQIFDGFVCEENSYCFMIKKNGVELSNLHKKNMIISNPSSYSHEPLCLLKIPFHLNNHNPPYLGFPIYIPKYDVENYPLLNKTYNFEPPLIKEPLNRYKRNDSLSPTLDDWINKLMVDQVIKNLEIFNLLYYEQMSLSLNTNKETKTKKIKI